jgi:hypothetical protein
MKKILASTFLGTSLLLGSPDAMGNFNHQKVIEDIKRRSQDTLLLNTKLSKDMKLKKIQEAIDEDIDPEETRILII